MTTSPPHEEDGAASLERAMPAQVLRAPRPPYFVVSPDGRDKLQSEGYIAMDYHLLVGAASSLVLRRPRPPYSALVSPDEILQSEGYIMDFAAAPPGSVHLLGGGGSGSRKEADPKDNELANAGFVAITADLQSCHPRHVGIALAIVEVFKYNMADAVTEAVPLCQDWVVPLSIPPLECGVFSKCSIGPDPFLSDLPCVTESHTTLVAIRFSNGIVVAADKIGTRTCSWTNVFLGHECTTKTVEISPRKWIVASGDRDHLRQFINAYKASSNQNEEEVLNKLVVTQKRKLKIGGFVLDVSSGTIKQFETRRRPIFCECLTTLPYAAAGSGRGTASRVLAENIHAGSSLAHAASIACKAIQARNLVDLSTGGGIDMIILMDDPLLQKDEEMVLGYISKSLRVMRGVIAEECTAHFYHGNGPEKKYLVGKVTRDERCCGWLWFLARKTRSIPGERRQYEILATDDEGEGKHKTVHFLVDGNWDKHVFGSHIIRQDSVAANVRECSSDTFPEMFALGATEEEIENVADALSDDVHDDLHAPVQEDYGCAAHYVKPFCRTLGMSGEAVQAAMDAAINVNDVGGRLQRYLPEVIAAAIIYIVCQLSDEKTLEDISGMCIVDYEELKFAVMDVQIVKDMELFPKGVKPPEMAGIEELVGDLCSQLGVRDQATRAAVEAAENVESPSSQELPEKLRYVQSPRRGSPRRRHRSSYLDRHPDEFVTGVLDFFFKSVELFLDVSMTAERFCSELEAVEATRSTRRSRRALVNLESTSANILYVSKNLFRVVDLTTMQAVRMVEW